MGFLERLFGYKEEPPDKQKASPYGAGGQEQRPQDADERALERYRYMLKTAPPETIEQAHEEAFARLTPAQRTQALRELAAATPERERGALAKSADDPKSLARLATRAEMRQPGVMERTFGGIGGRGGSGMGMASTIFGSLVAGFVGSMVAQQFLDSMDDFDFGGDDTSELSADEVAAAAEEDSGYYGGGDYASDDFGDFGGDFGGDF